MVFQTLILKKVKKNIKEEQSIQEYKKEYKAIMSGFQTMIGQLSMITQTATDNRYFGVKEKNSIINLNNNNVISRVTHGKSFEDNQTDVDTNECLNHITLKQVNNAKKDLQKARQIYFDFMKKYIPREYKEMITTYEEFKAKYRKVKNQQHYDYFTKAIANIENQIDKFNAVTLNQIDDYVFVWHKYKYAYETDKKCYNHALCADSKQESANVVDSNN